MPNIEEILDMPGFRIFVNEAKAKLENWLKEHTEFKAVGKPYAVFWNSPFHLWFMKHFEIHIPVSKNI